MDWSFVYDQLSDQTTGFSVLHSSPQRFLLNSWRIDFSLLMIFPFQKRCLEDCKAVCPSGMTMNTILVLKASVYLHRDAASHSIIHKNAVFNLLDDRCNTADPTCTLAHPQRPSFSLFSCNNSPLVLFFLLRIEKTYQEGLRDTEERKGQWLHVSADAPYWCAAWTPSTSVVPLLKVQWCCAVEQRADWNLWIWVILRGTNIVWQQVLDICYGRMKGLA